MIRRLYVHNFRCLENFDLPVSGRSSALLIGNNGAGKTTVGRALEVLQKLARGTNRVRELVTFADLAQGRADAPVRFEIEVEIGGQSYAYGLAFELPKGFRELRVLEEKLAVGGAPVYSRDRADVRLARGGPSKEAVFQIDWHLVALPILQYGSSDDPISTFKQWISRMLILRPMPSLITGESTQDTLEPAPDVHNLGGWFSGLLAYAPSAYVTIDQFLRQLLPDLRDIKNPLVSSDSRELMVQFAAEQESLTLPFRELSDGEKCFMICALVLAARDTLSSPFCFWDEPDNYLAPSEVGHFVIALRKAFESGGQFIATSHNPEAIRSFSDENTLLLHRKSRLEPTTIRPVSDLQIHGDLVGALIRGDVEP